MPSEPYDPSNTYTFMSSKGYKTIRSQDINSRALASKLVDDAMQPNKCKCDPSVAYYACGECVKPVDNPVTFAGVLSGPSNPVPKQPVTEFVYQVTFDDGVVMHVIADEIISAVNVAKEHNYWSSAIVAGATFLGEVIR